MFVWPEPIVDFVSGVNPPDRPGPAWYFVFVGNNLLMRFDEAGQWVPLTEADRDYVEKVAVKQHYMGRLGDHDCVAVEAAELPGEETSGLRALFGHSDNLMFSLASRAVQVVDWYKGHQFCGRCGGRNREHTSDRAMICEDCGIHAYPRLSPSIIVLVHRGREALLARNHRFPDGMYSTLAGFVEPGESVEETLVREVKEEVGVNVHKLNYLGSQSWPFPNSLMLGFHAEYESGDIVLQEDEIADAGWFDCDELPNIPGGVAISRWLIDAWLDTVAGEGR